MISPGGGDLGESEGVARGSRGADDHRLGDVDVDLAIATVDRRKTRVARTRNTREPGALTALSAQSSRGDA